MSDPAHLDGNAVGGILRQVFGEEMTGRRGRCKVCSTVSYIASVVAYTRGPGHVLRCPGCGSVLLVIVETPSGVRMGFEALSWLELR